MEKKKKFNHRFYDVLVIIAIVLMLGTHFITNVFLVKQQDMTSADYDKVVEVHEANPVARYIFTQQSIKVIFSVIIMPALLLAIYFALRRKQDPYITSFVAYYFFFIALYNINNDAGALLGLMLK